jgi:hypothetical protein
VIVDLATTAQLERLERLLMDPAVRRDRARVAELLAEEFTEFGASGRVWTREAILDLLATEEYTPPVVEKFSCRELAEDVALATYRAVRTDAATGARAVTLRSSVWVRQSGAWRMVFHQGTRAAE